MNYFVFLMQIVNECFLNMKNSVGVLINIKILFMCPSLFLNVIMITHVIKHEIYMLLKTMRFVYVIEIYYSIFYV